MSSQGTHIMFLQSSALWLSHMVLPVDGAATMADRLHLLLQSL